MTRRFLIGAGVAFVALAAAVLVGKLLLIAVFALTGFDG